MPMDTLFTVLLSTRLSTSNFTELPTIFRDKISMELTNDQYAGQTSSHRGIHSSWWLPSIPWIPCLSGLLIRTFTPPTPQWSTHLDNSTILPSTLTKVVRCSMIRTSSIRKATCSRIICKFPTWSTSPRSSLYTKTSEPSTVLKSWLTTDTPFIIPRAIQGL